MALFRLYYFPWVTFLIYIFQEILNTTYLSIGIKITQDHNFDLFSMNLIYGDMYSSFLKWIFMFIFHFNSETIFIIALLK